MLQCPECGEDLPPDGSACSKCGHSVNGTGVTQDGDSTRQRAHSFASASETLSAELLELARQQFSEEEFVAGLREIRQSGGLELQDFIEELEKDATPRD